ncbi:MAG: tyrosine-type recombinase/integrase [Pseudorhodobacter sp.]|nr:tyrosine-type recombinase/integrase [Frankiaceae bacterium]
MADRSVFTPRVASSAMTLTELDAAVDQYLASPCLRPTTVQAYVKNWRTWKRFCAARDYDPLRAPATAMLQFMAACGTGQIRADPSLGALSPRTVDVLVAGIGHALRELGLPRPDETDPAVAVKFGLVRIGYRRWFARSQGRPPKLTLPLRIADVQQLVSPASAVAFSDPPLAALRLLMLHHTETTATACRVQVRDLLRGDAGVLLDIAGSRLSLSCDHETELSMACLGCLLSQAAWGRGPTELLFGSAGGPSTAVGLCQQRRKQLRSWSQHWGVVDFAGDSLTERQGVAGALLAERVALLTLLPEELATLRLRAMLLLTWHLGLRGDDVCRRLRRRDVTRSTRGYRVVLRASKGDPNGQQQTLGLRPAKGVTLCAVLALDAWLAVLDSAADTNPDLPLFCALIAGRTALRPDEWLTVRSWGHELKVAAQRSGLDAVFTTRSSRTGFAATAERQGATLEQIQQILRHVEPETTLVYLDPRRGRDAAAAVASMLRAPR